MISEEVSRSQPAGAASCYLCGLPAEIEGDADHAVTCRGACGRYLITRQARRELGLIPGTKTGMIPGRKGVIVKKTAKLRLEDPERHIRIARDLLVCFD